MEVNIVTGKFNRCLVDSNLIFHAFSTNSNDYIYIWDCQSSAYVVSENLARDFAIDIEGTDFFDIWRDFIHPRDLERVQDIVTTAVNQKKTKGNIEYQAITQQGTHIWLSDKFSVHYNEQTNEAEVVIGVMHNLSYDGEVDPITGLLMHTKCKSVFDLLQANKLVHHGALMMLGIDEFTSINTLNDHIFGDLVLRATAQDLLNIMPENATMYRYDGDQLLVVVDKSTKQELLDLYLQIKEYTSKSHKIQDKEYRFTISAGIASYPEDGISWFDLEKAVSIALKSAKQMGKNRYAEFTSEMYKEKVYEQSLGRYLADSVEHGFKDFHVVFQPVCFAQNLKVKGAEILLRFVNPLGELISPEQFIPLLEQSQLIIPVGLWVLEKAIIACKKWTEYVEDFVMNVNVSYIQLRDLTFCDHVEALLKKYDLDVKHIVLELTESYFITDASNINISMNRLRDLHLQVAMDDFGTGYSSLARLAQFNVDVVKIDRSFVQSLHKSKYNHDFIDSVVRLCHNIGMKVCVEGVETKEEQESICVLNTDYIQGYYVSKPINEEAFFNTYILKPNINDNLVVIPNLQLRHDQLVSDRDVLSAMMDATPLGLNFWNRDYEVIACNIEILRWFEVKNFQEFKDNFDSFSPKYQPDGRLSRVVVQEVISKAFDGEKVSLYWEHCKLNKEPIPTEVTAVRIPFMDDYIVATYSRDMREQRIMENKIERFNTRLAAILDSSPLCLNLWNQDYQNIMCNKAAVALFDLNNQQEYLDRFFDLSPLYQPDGALSTEKAQEYIKKAFNEGRYQFHWMHRNLQGEKIPTEITLVRIEELDENGNALVAGYTRDIRSQLESQRLQQQINNRIRAVLDSSPVACILWSEDLHIVDCNQVAIHMLGADDKQDVMHNFNSFMPLTQPDGDNSLLKKDKIFEEIFERKSMNFEWVYINKAQEEVPCEVTIVRIPLEKEDIIVAYSRDLRELNHTLELNDRLSKMAYYDLLTGVTSRARFTERLETSFTSMSCEDGFALALFDIDNFKNVNDSYGHVIGDVVLKKVAKSIENILPKNAMIARYGGDEFILQFNHINKQELEALLQKIVHEITTIEFEHNGDFFTTSISLGASFKGGSDKDFQQLINRADKALYATKQNGRNGYKIL